MITYSINHLFLYILLMKTLKRRVDLGESGINRVLFYEKIIRKILRTQPAREAAMNETTQSFLKVVDAKHQSIEPPIQLNPKTCLEILKYVAEVRNAALTGEEESRGEYKLRESYFERDINADLGWMMRVIKRFFNGTLPEEFKGSQLYYEKQRAIFKQLKKVKRKAVGSQEPGKLSYKQPGQYNGIAWIIQCFDAALSFDKETSAAVLHSYFW